VLKEQLPESDAVPAGLYSKAYLSSQFNSEVGPGGCPCEGFNQPLLWYPVSMDPPPDHPWAGPDWDSLSSIFAADFERIQRADMNRLDLYAVGRRALATDDAGVFLHPGAVVEIETRCDTLLTSVTRLCTARSPISTSAHLCAPLPKVRWRKESRRSSRPWWPTASSALEHTMRMQIVWHHKQVEKAEQAAQACQQLLRGQNRLG
jgi:hypothetical protein